MPTLGQRARDPVAFVDFPFVVALFGGEHGTIWWAGQWGNLIAGRIDPTTGEMKEYPLPADAMLALGHDR